jgi:hypothetical protein
MLKAITVVVAMETVALATVAMVAVAMVTGDLVTVPMVTAQQVATETMHMGESLSIVAVMLLCLQVRASCHR